jgi:ketosteroid isomerase-like protein
VGNVDIVLTIYERVARGETVRELFHEDVEWSMPHPGGEAHGLAEVGAFWRDYEATWTERVLEVEEVRPLDDERVLVFFRETAVGRASGIETDASPAAIWTLRDGRVARFQAWIQRSDAVRAAGLEA